MIFLKIHLKSPPCRPPFFLVVKKGVVLGPSNQLKIAEHEAYGYPLIATRAFRARQNSYGFRAIWSWNFFSTKFPILRDLLRNLILAKIKLRSYFPAQQLIYIKNYFDTIEDLLIGFHLEKLNNWGQNSYGRTTIWSLISSGFVVFLEWIKKVLPTSFIDITYILTYCWINDNSIFA